jgi:uncharacterized protein YidB (DUF937 family)
MAGLGDLLGGLFSGSRKSGGGADLGGILGGILGGSGGNTAMMAGLLPMVTRMLGKGGLTKILSGFQAKGLSAEADSWVGKGENKSVSADQVSSVVGSDKVAEIAKKLGVSQSKAAGALAQLLPKVISHVTPDGRIPAKRDLKGALKELKEAAA